MAFAFVGQRELTHVINLSHRRHMLTVAMTERRAFQLDRIEIRR
jgi:hypothetical protein